ncbi:MAG: holo-[acyl-carrier protein] synthase, partial [Colwellia sp.]
LYLAKRWAGKEAASKALGTGIANGVSFQHFEIISLPSGQPKLILNSRAEELAIALGAKTWLISLSDETLYATAFVVLSS